VPGLGSSGPRVAAHSHIGCEIASTQSTATLRAMRDVIVWAVARVIRILLLSTDSGALSNDSGGLNNRT
jgi:hypothetical protein